MGVFMDSMTFPLLHETEMQLPYFLTGAGHWNNQEHIVRVSGYQDFQWFLCRSGEGVLILGDQTHIMKANRGFLLYPHIPHEYYPTVEPWGIDWVVFQGSHVENLLRTAGMEASGPYSVNHFETIQVQMQNLLLLAQSGSPMRGFECSKSLYALLVDLMKYVSLNNASLQQQYIKLQPALDHIDLNHARTITLQDLADVIQVTPQHFCLLFKSIMKVRPVEYINVTRINKSKMLLLADVRIKIRDIAVSVGFDNFSYFSAVFRKLEGVSPEQFRQLHNHLY
jgi:AraC family transcriptional regulator, arabinose operon regulatory protein